MIRLGIAPRLIDFAQEARATIDSWFNAVTARFNVNSKAGSVTTAEVPTNQWGLFKNSTSGALSLTANDNGTLRSVRLASSTENAVVSASAASVTAVSSGVFTKVTLDTELIDTDGSFSSSRFQPNVAGYYLVSANLTIKQLTATTNAIIAAIYLNGVSYLQAAIFTEPGVADYSVPITCLISLNGSTDFVELYGFQNSGVSRNTTTGGLTHFHAHLVRAL